MATIHVEVVSTERSLLSVDATEIYARADAATKRKAIEDAYEPLTPDVLPDWTSDPPLIGWLDSLGR